MFFSNNQIWQILSFKFSWFNFILKFSVVHTHSMQTIYRIYLSLVQTGSYGNLFQEIVNMYGVVCSGSRMILMGTFFMKSPVYTVNYPKKPGFNLYQLRHCAYITYSVKTWFLKNLSVPATLTSMQTLWHEMLLAFIIAKIEKLMLAT